MDSIDTVDGRNPAPVDTVGILSHYLHVFCTSQVVSRISSINSIIHLDNFVFKVQDVGVSSTVRW